MKKVLMVTGSLNRGGLEKVAIQIAKTLDRSNYQFDFLIYEQSDKGFEKEVMSLGCNIIEIPKPSNNYFKYYYNLKKIIKTYGPYDIVHSHVYYNSGIVMYTAKKCGVPLCISHSHSIKRTKDNKIVNKFIYAVLRQMLINYSDKCIACSFEAGSNLFGYDYFNSNGIVILNPVDLEKYKFSKFDRELIRNKLNIKDDQIVLGQVSRLVKGKNQKFLLDVFKVFLEKRNGILLVVGDGPELKNLLEYAKNIGIYDNTRFVGYKNNVESYLSSMDIFVMTSFNEGLGIVLIEAAANGLPSVCNYNAIVKEVKKLNLCIPITSYNAFEWSSEIDKLIDKNTSRKLNHKDLNNFTVSNFKEKIELLYRIE